MSSEEPTLALDGIANLVTGLLIQGRDKAMNATPAAPREFDQEEARDLYRSGGIAARIVDLPAQDMTRAGFDLEIAAITDEGEGIDIKQAQQIGAKMLDRWESLGLLRQIKRALRWEALYGGAIVLIGIDDGLETSKPVGTIKEIRFVRAIDRWRLIRSEPVEDVADPRFGDPEWYEFSPRSGGTVRLHHSRVLEFPGLVDLDEFTKETNMGWSDSVFTRIWHSLRQFEEAYGHAGALIYDFSQAIWKIKDLAKIIKAGGEKDIQARAQIMDLVASILNTRLLDKDNEEWERRTTDIGQLPALLDRFGVHLAAELGWPLTLLLGLTPAGFTKNDETGQANWDDIVNGWQTERLVPQLEKITGYLFQAQRGPTSGREPVTWKVVPRPLTQLDERAQAELRKMTAESDAIYLTNEVLSPDEVARSRFRQSGWSMETQLDEEAREAIREAEEERARDPDPPIPPGPPQQEEPEEPEEAA